MLIGMICRVVDAIAEREEDDAAIRLVKESILMNLKKFDQDGSGTISQSELMQVINNPQSKHVLKMLNIDILFMLELQGMLFTDSESEVPIKKVIELMLMCRG